MQPNLKYLAKAVRELTDAHPGKSGVIALSDGYDALAARIKVADLALSSLDIQSYIWENDLTGSIMFKALYRAAERGVRVRLLLDDHNTQELDYELATLNAHSNIEIRLFNPFRKRRWRVIRNLTDFSRLNRRMHNKSFTADGQVSILGGRNIGDEYFNAGQDILFLDLDVLTVGQVVQEVVENFDRYWTSKMSYPAHKILKSEPVKNKRNFSIAASIIKKTPAARKYLEALKRSRFSGELNGLPFEWTNVQMVSDDPSKVMENFSSDQVLLQDKLLNMIDLPIHELLLIVPYFVPGKEGVKFITQLRENHVQVKILTNSYEATDVAIIHAGYAKHRKKLLESGVILYELKASMADLAVHDPELTANTSSSLHAKTFCIDRTEVFIGSCNFDPRSSLLNTEMGVLIESTTMAQKAADLFAHEIPANSYEVRLNDKGKLFWKDRPNGSEIILEKEPGLDIFHQAGVSFFSKLPIEWLL